MQARTLIAVATFGLATCCLLPRAGAQKIYWADSQTEKIQRANLDGSNVEDLITSGLANPRGMGLDLEAGKMYWGEVLLSGSGKIRCADLNGSNIRDIAVSKNAVIDLALDVVHGKVYWTDDFDLSSRIQRANLDGSNVEVIASTGPETTFGIAIDSAGGKIYWARNTFDGPRIQRADLDGSNVENTNTVG